MASTLDPILETEAASVTASVLHTLGAITYLGSLVAYLVWFHHLRTGQGRHRILMLAHFSMYASLAINFFGGYLRTIQPGHPGLTEFAHSPWVRIMVAKHLFLIVGAIAAIYIFEVLVPRLVRASRNGAINERLMRRHHIATAIVILGIATATIMGAYSQIVPLDDDDGMPDGNMDDDDDGGPPPIASTDRDLTFEGQLTSIPIAPGRSTGAFEVTPGTANLTASLTWEPSQTTLDLTLLAPNGTSHYGVPGNDATTRINIQNPANGTWRYEIGSELAVQAQWSLLVRVAAASLPATHLADIVTIAPGTFCEVNTHDMAVGGQIHWSWRVEDDVEVDYNIHTHFDGDVQYVVEFSAARSTGNYTIQRDGPHSFMWDNPTNAPVTLHYQAWGDFEVESVFGC